MTTEREESLRAFGAHVRKVARMRRALWADAGLSSGGLTRELFVSLLERGVPAHAAAHGAQHEKLTPAALKTRLFKGETVFLVQPHEYMPVLRRCLWRVADAAGFTGRPLHSYLFCVWKPGTPAMPMHDDGDTDLVWWQIDGERFVRFGSGRGEAVPVEAADGVNKGWFEGPLPAGSLLYLPPHMQHQVQCRKPSLALSAYWDPVPASEAAADFLGWKGGDGGGRNPGRRGIAQVLRSAAEEADEPVFRQWAALRRSDDGARDYVSADAEGEGWTARRAVVAWREGAEAWLAAGGECLLSFPREALPVLEAFGGYATLSDDELDTLGRRLGHNRLTRLLEILASEGVIARGILPLVAKFEVEGLSGWNYAATEGGLPVHKPAR